jgi:hypothetical protein
MAFTSRNMGKCITCGKERTLDRDFQCHECAQTEYDNRFWAACPEHGDDRFPSGSCHECAMLQPPPDREEQTS